LSLKYSIKTVLFLLSLLVTSSAWAQLELKDSVIVKGLRLAVMDDLGNTYTVAKDNTITLRKKSGLVFTFNEKSFGEVKHIDPANPMKILVHYADANQILFLDNTLSEIGRLDLNTLGVYGLNVLVGNSRLNGFWLFNPVELNLSRYDNNGKRLSGNQLNAFIQQADQPQMIQEKNGKLYMSLGSGKTMGFDINATYLFQLQTPGIKDFRVEGEHLFYFNGEVIVVRNLETVEQKQLPLPRNLQKAKKKVVAIQCGSNRCLIALKNKLLFYDLK